MNPLDTNKKTIENGCLTRTTDLNYHTQNTIKVFMFFFLRRRKLSNLSYKRYAKKLLCAYYSSSFFRGRFLVLSGKFGKFCKIFQVFESRCLTFPRKKDNFVASKLIWNARQKLPITGIKKFN